MMAKLDGVLIDTDVLVIGGGAGGLLAALSAKRHGPPGTRVTLVDSWLIGRTGHTAFSNAWKIVVFPDDDLDGITREIVAGNDGIADQVLVREVLADSYARLKDFELQSALFEDAGVLAELGDGRVPVAALAERQFQLVLGGSRNRREHQRGERDQAQHHAGN